MNLEKRLLTIGFTVKYVVIDFLSGTFLRSYRISISFINRAKVGSVVEDFKWLESLG